MAGESRASYIKALAEKFIKLVESLEPGERLSITKVSAPKKTKPIQDQARLESEAETAEEKNRNSEPLLRRSCLTRSPA